MSRTHAIAIGLLGIWIGLTLFMWFAAGASFRTVDRVIKSPSEAFKATSQPLTHDQIRVVLRYAGSEINRTLFAAYSWAQLITGLVLLSILFSRSPRDTASLIVASLMLTIVIILMVLVTPRVVALGRGLDFAPRNPLPPQWSRFRTLHATYTALDGAKLLAAIGLLIRLILIA